MKFESVEDFLGYLPDYERKIVDQLRIILLECIPDCIEKLSYNVPFYYRHSRICFIWPSSIPWGNVNLNGVQLGFCRGDLLGDGLNYLEKGHRKQVYIRTFYDVKEIDADLIRSYILDAIEVDDFLKKEKKAKGGKQKTNPV
ncbi:MAG: DUF1801 domain-containing protein [Cyclobacteriaceae bacterium]|nr:DUF1801 domain-containing protein [Cyclobacteriaceae bacterium]